MSNFFNIYSNSPVVSNRGFRVDIFSVLKSVMYALKELSGQLSFSFLVLCHFFYFFLTAPPLPSRAVTLYVVRRRRTQLQALIAISQGWGAYKLGDK